jgi:hypothetical protein
MNAEYHRLAIERVKSNRGPCHSPVKSFPFTHANASAQFEFYPRQNNIGHFAAPDLDRLFFAGVVSVRCTVTLQD